MHLTRLATAHDMENLLLCDSSHLSSLNAAANRKLILKTSQINIKPNKLTRSKSVEVFKTDELNLSAEIDTEPEKKERRSSLLIVSLNL